MFFYKPYYLEPQKGGDKVYALLRESLEKSKKVGIAKVAAVHSRKLVSAREDTRRYTIILTPRIDIFTLAA